MTEAEVKASQRIFVNNCLAMLGIENLGLKSLGMGIFLFAESVSWVKEASFLVSWNNLFFSYPSISSDEECVKRKNNEEYTEL